MWSIYPLHLTSDFRPLILSCSAHTYNHRDSFPIIYVTSLSRHPFSSLLLPSEWSGDFILASSDSYLLLRPHFWVWTCLSHSKHASLTGQLKNKISGNSSLLFPLPFSSLGTCCFLSYRTEAILCLHVGFGGWTHTQMSTEYLSGYLLFILQGSTSFQWHFSAFSRATGNIAGTVISCFTDHHH